ncbi:MAG: ABC transporter permease [Acidimicrobiales bacterium]
MSTPAALRVANREFVLYRRVWRQNVTGALVQPLLYLLGVGLGIGSLVDDGADSAELLGGASYFGFYATALLSTTAMFIAGQEALWQTMNGFHWDNAYRAMVATPIRPRDVATGMVLRFAGRAGVGSLGVAIVLLFFDETRSWGLFAAVPVGIMCGLAFAMPLAAWTSTRMTDNSFPAILRFVLTPMFLFGGAFYPIDQLPAVIRPVAWVTPLWHAIELCRGAILGGLGSGLAVLHLTVLVLYVVGGWWVCTITFRRRLWP